MTCTPAELAKAARWLAKPGNREKHRAAVARCRQRPHAKEAHRQRQLRYAAANREQERLRVAKWRRENPEKAKASNKRNYEKNYEARAAANCKWARKNPELVREYRAVSKARRRGATAGVRLPYGFRPKLMESQGFMCANPLCGADLRTVKPHLDHVVAVSRGGAHTPENLQYLCAPCNQRKATKDFAEFIRGMEARRA